MKRPKSSLRWRLLLSSTSSRISRWRLLQKEYCKLCGETVSVQPPAQPTLDSFGRSCARGPAQPREPTTHIPKARLMRGGGLSLLSCPRPPWLADVGLKPGRWLPAPDIPPPLGSPPRQAWAKPGSDTRCQRPTPSPAHTRQLRAFMRSWAGPAERAHHSHPKSQADERRGTLPFKLPTAPLASRCGTKAGALTTSPWHVRGRYACPGLVSPRLAMPGVGRWHLVSEPGLAYACLGGLSKGGGMLGADS
jgi:hypothetical protein